MARPKKPAKLKTGHNQSKAELAKEAKKEDFVGGGKDSIYTPPIDLTNDQKQYYKYIVKNLQNSNILSNLDIFVVAQTAICLSRMKQIDDILNKQSPVQYKKNSDGYYTPFEHPAVAIKSKYMSQFKTLSTQLGLTPSSRSQLASLDIQQAQDEKNPLKNIIKKINE